MCIEMLEQDPDIDVSFIFLAMHIKLMHISVCHEYSYINGYGKWSFSHNRVEVNNDLSGHQ